MESCRPGGAQSAERLKNVDDFQIHATSGKPLRVGIKQEFQVKSVTDEAIMIGNKNVDMPFTWKRMKAITSLALIERALERDAGGLAHLAFLRILAFGNKEVTTATESAADAGETEEKDPYDWKPIGELLPVPLWVSSLEASSKPGLASISLK